VGVAPRGGARRPSRLERHAIERACGDCGNRRQRRPRLGMPLRTFYDKLKRYGIS